MGLSLSKTTRFDVATTVLKPIEKGLFTQDFVAPAEPAPSRALLCPAGIHFDDQYVGEGKTISKEPYYLVNTDRAVGTRLAGDIARRQRAEGKIQPVEYMTNGVVLVLGPTGINVGSGMTGGVAYLYDPSVNDDMIAGRLKLTNVKPRRVQDGSPAADTIQRLLREHHEATASKHAKHLLENFDASHFCQVVPPSEEDKPHHAVVADSVEEMAVSR